MSARLSLSEVVDSSAALFADNINGDITPAKLRQWISELISAIRPAYAYIVRSAAVVQALTTTPAPLVFDSGYVSEVVDYTTTPPSGLITRTDPGTTRLTFTADIAVPGNQSRTIVFTVYKNGVPTAWKQSITTSTAGLTESISLPVLEYANVLANYQLYVQIDVATSVTFSNMVLIAETVPVWTYS